MQLLATFTTLFIGGIGGLVAWLVGAPVPFLTGPATLVTIAALFGVKCVVNTYIRNISFIIIGISIGSSVNPQVLDAAKLWPTTIFGMGFSLVTLIFIGKLLLQKKVLLVLQILMVMKLQEKQEPHKNQLEGVTQEIK